MKLAWDASGAGPTVVVLHGFTGSRTSWGRAADLLAERFRVVRLDLPGHGGSPDPSPRDGFAEVVASVAEAISTACSETPTVLGYSQGARVAIGLAIEHPSALDALILESGSAGLTDLEARAARQREDAQWADLLRRDGLPSFVDRWEQVPVLSGLTRLPSAERARLRAGRLAQRPEGLAAALRSYGLGAQPDLSPRLSERRGPTLVLTGALDAKFTALGKQLAARIPGAEQRVLAGCGHTPHLEAPDAWAEAVSSFITSTRSSHQPRRTA